MPFVYDKLIKFALKFIGGVMAIVPVVSMSIALVSDGPFMPTLALCMFIGGVAVLGVGALVGAGMSEGRAQRAALMTGGHHSNYYQEFAKERGRRRDDQTFFMVMMAGAGLLLIILAFCII